MHEPRTPIVSCLAAMLLLGAAFAQDNTATQPSKPTHSSFTPAKTSAVARKPASTTGKPAAAGAALTTQKQKAS